MRTFFIDILWVLKIYFLERFAYIIWLAFVPGPGTLSRASFASFVESYLGHDYSPINALLSSIILVPTALLLYEKVSKKIIPKSNRLLVTLIIYVSLLYIFLGLHKAYWWEYNFL